jgi:hypothetical protein
MTGNPGLLPMARHSAPGEISITRGTMAAALRLPWRCNPSPRTRVAVTRGQARAAPVRSSSR